MSSKTPYFGKYTESAIVEYIQCKDEHKKRKIFIEKIKPAFDKLVENIINYKKFNFKELDKYEILHAETLSHLYEQLDKFDYKKISIKTKQKVKAFSYFGTVAKNFLVQMSLVKKKEQNVIMNDLKQMKNEQNEDKQMDLIDNIKAESNETQEEIREFLKIFCNILDRDSSICVNENEKKVSEAISFLIKNVDKYNIYNKKHLFVILKEYTGLNNKKINKALGDIKEKYLKVKYKYYNYQI